MNLPRKVWLVGVALLFTVLAGIGTPQSHARGASGGRVAIDQLVVTQDTFPEVELRVAVVDGKGMPVSGLTLQDFEVTENGQKMALSAAEEISAGVRTALVLDMGKWMNNRGFGGQVIKEAMRAVAQTFIESMRNADEVELIAVYGRTPQVVLPFTSDKERLREALYALDWENREYSYGIEGIKQAAADLLAANAELPRTILFLSAGLMQRDMVNTNETKLAGMLQAHNIPVFSIYFPWKAEDTNIVYRIQWFPEQTGGLFVRRERAGSEDQILRVLDRYRIQYRLKYRTPNGQDTEREVTVRYQTLYASVTYHVEPGWIAPGQVNIVVNNGEPVWRKAESPRDDVRTIPMTSAPVEITLQGLGNRQVKEAHLYINGNEVPLTEVAPLTYTTTWDLTGLTEGGEHAVLLEFSATDELGVVTQGQTTVAVEVTPPLALNPICSAVAGLPLVGAGMAAVCMRLGVNWMTLVLTVAVVALSVALWHKRETVVEVGRDLSVRATHVVRRLTNRLQKMEPKAKLEIVRGLPEGARKELNIFGETKIGRSHEHANLVLENPNVSRLHCILHEEMNGGWSIEDQDSANGTFVNGKQIPPFKPVPIQDGARIELAPVEYGGVEMIFHVLSQPLDELFAEDSGVDLEDSFATMSPAALGEEDWREARETARLGSSADDLFDLDDEANQRW